VTGLLRASVVVSVFNACWLISRALVMGKRYSGSAVNSTVGKVGGGGIVLGDLQAGVVGKSSCGTMLADAQVIGGDWFSS